MIEFVSPIADTVKFLSIMPISYGLFWPKKIKRALQVLNSGLKS